MRIRVLICALAISPAAIAQEEWPIARRGDLGVRYWLSTGETKRSHNAQGVDPALGNPTSVLLYENLDANVLELFWRQNFRNSLFLKGTVGVGRINRGMFDDEDFEAGQVKFSDTTSSVTQGRIGYGTLDLGYQWVLGEGAVTLGVFGGLSQWTENVDAYGATDHLGFIGGDISRDVKVISNDVVWRALRVGFGGEFVFGRRARLSVDLAMVPYAKVRNEDSHYLRDDLGPVPNIILEGEGWGVQWDAELRYEIFRRTQLGIGVRYWHMKITDGTRQLPNDPGFPELPLTELYSKRTGVTLSLRRAW
jgi:hypothetical protein